MTSPRSNPDERRPSYWELYRGHTIAIVGLDSFGPVVRIRVMSDLGEGQTVGCVTSIAGAKRTIDGWAVSDRAAQNQTHERS